MRGIALRVQQDDEVEIRTEQLFGQDHLVVPVVALVQGVLQGMSAENPELALAEEFGRFPQGWDGRPLVMNHPVINNQPVSANSPTVLEAYAFGQIFNSKVAEGRLKVEAWINLARVEEMGGEVADLVTRINDGKVIEVSTGLFTGVEERSGKFNGKQYVGIWRNIVPDHLAFLSEGSVGACSVADGCGTPRVNARSEPGWDDYSYAEDLQVTDPHNHSDGSCSCGCGGKCGGDKMADNSNSNSNSDPNGKVEPSFTVDRFLANMFPDGLMDSDVRKLLSEAVKLSRPTYVYLLGYTASKVIYEYYSDALNNYQTSQRSYEISADRQVTLGDDEQLVDIFLEVTPKKVKANSDPDSETSKTQEPPMTTVNSNQTTEDPQADKSVDKPTAQIPPTALSAATQPVVPPTQAPVAAVKFNTVKEFFDAAPAELRESLESGLKLHNQRKGSLIKALQDTGRCKFSDDALKAMSLENLEQLVDLAGANLPDSYAGIATPKVQSESDRFAPAMPTLFPAK